MTGILCGAVVGIVTVFIAAHSPAKQAAKVSPVAAVSGNTGTSKHGGCAAKSGVFKIETSLGIHHATEAKKNFIPYYRLICAYDCSFSIVCRLP